VDDGSSSGRSSGPRSSSGPLGQIHGLDAQAHHAQFLRRGLAQVDDPAWRERSAIIDAHHHHLAVDQAAHAYPRPERQRAVRGGEFPTVKTLAAGRAPAMQAAAVPGGQPSPEQHAAFFLVFAAALDGGIGFTRRRRCRAHPALLASPRRGRYA